MQSRTTIVAGAGLLASIVATCIGGCAAPEKKLLPVYEREDVETLPMRPEWRAFADDNYLGVVLAHLNNPAGAGFVESPKVVATRNKTRNATELLAAGSVDVLRAGGKKDRRPYTIVWRQAGHGWEVSDVQVAPGQEAPAPLAPPPIGPLSRPATGPAAPAASGIAPAASPG